MHYSIIAHLFDTALKMKFSIKDFFSKSDQIRRKLRIWSHLLKKSLMENFVFCAVWILQSKLKEWLCYSKITVKYNHFQQRFSTVCIIIIFCRIFIMIKKNRYNLRNINDFESLILRTISCTQYILYLGSKI